MLRKIIHPSWSEFEDNTPGCKVFSEKSLIDGFKSGKFVKVISCCLDIKKKKKKKKKKKI